MAQKNPIVINNIGNISKSVKNGEIGKFTISEPISAYGNISKVSFSCSMKVSNGPTRDVCYSIINIGNTEIYKYDGAHDGSTSYSIGPLDITNQVVNNNGIVNFINNSSMIFSGYSNKGTIGGVINTAKWEITNIKIEIQYSIPDYTIKVTPGVGCSKVKINDSNNTEIIVEAGTEVKLSAENTEGYHWGSWDNGNESNPYTFTVTSDLNLIANFIENQYYIKFLPNGGTGQENIVGPIKYTESYYLPFNNFTGPTYTFYYDYNNATSVAFPTENIDIERSFDGWKYTKDDGNITLYFDGAQVVKLTSENNKTIEFFAIWNPEVNVLLPQPTKKYYAFLGWLDIVSQTTMYEPTTTPIKFNSNQAFIAKWKKNHYRAYLGDKDLETMYKKSRKIEKIFVGTTEV